MAEAPHPTQGIRFTKRRPLTALHPLKALRTILFILRTFVHKTIGPALFVLRSSRPNAQWTASQASGVAWLRAFFHYAWATQADDHARPALQADASIAAQFALVPPGAPRLYQKTARGDANVAPETVSGCWYPEAYAAQHDAGAAVILHFHGGGYTTGEWRPWWSGPAATALTRATGAKALLVGYRKTTARGQHFPAQLQDAISAYDHLLTGLGIAAPRVVLSGDSAGGNLVLALLRYVHEERTLPLPGAALLVSPWLDLSTRAAELQRLPEARTDFLPPGYLEYAAESLVPSGVDPRHPFISPGRHPFRLGVPTWVEVGEGEMFRASIEQWVAATRARGDDIAVRLVRNGTHDNFWCGPMMDMHAEVEASARDVARFLDERGLGPAAGRR